MSWRRASAASSPAREGRTASCAKAGGANVQTSKTKANRLPRGQTERTIRLIKNSCPSLKDRPAKGGATALPSRPQIDANLALSKVPNRPPLTFQLHVADLPMVTQRYDVIQGKRGDAGRVLMERPAKKRKSVAQSKLRTTTYVEVPACNRSDSGRYKFSNVRGAESQRNV